MSRNIPLGFLAGSGRSITWQTQSISNQVYQGGVYANLANAKYFGFGASSTGTNTSTYARSTDGISFITGTLPSSLFWARAATNGTRVVVTSNSSTASGAYTDNGTTWTSTTIWGTAQATRDILWDGTRFLAISGNLTAANLAHSTNGATWGQVDVGSGFRAIAYDGGSNYLLTENTTSSNGRLCAGDPTNNANYNNVTFPSSRFWTGVVYGNGLWIIHDHDTYATSPNGTTWTQGTLPNNIDQSVSSPRVAKMNFVADKFYFVSGQGNAGLGQRVYSSSDGSTWTLETTTSIGSFNRSYAGWANGPDKIIGFGYNSDSAGTNDQIAGTG